MDQESGQRETIRPDHDLVKRICQSRRFKKWELGKTILKILFKNSLQEVPQKLSTAEIILRCDSRTLTAQNVRKQASDLRSELELYFRQRDEEISFLIEDKTYLLKFQRNQPRLVSAGQNLDLFWSSYLSYDWTVRFIVDDFPDFTDLTPKRHWTDSGLQVPVRGDREVIRGEEYRYLPTGLLKALLTFDRFFALQKKPIPFEYDTSLEAPALTGSLIIVGVDPFESAFRTWPTKDGGWFFFAEDDSTPQHKRSSAPRDGLMKATQPRFAYHASVERLPIYKSNFFKTIIKAHHSVAVEAAADFLTSETRMGEVFSAQPQEPLKHLHLALRVVCKVIHLDALKLAPGIPRIYLKPLRTELLRVNDEPMRVLTEDGDTDTELERTALMIHTLSEDDEAQEYTEPNTGITFIKT